MTCLSTGQGANNLTDAIREDSTSRSGGFPQEWGSKIYEPLWAKRSRFRRPSVIFTSIASIVAAAAVLVYSIVTFKQGELLSAIISASIAIIALIYITVSVIILTENLRRVPFRIFQKGITDKRVALSDAIRGRQELIPWSGITKLELERARVKGFEVPYLSLGVCTSSGPSRRIVLDARDVEEPMRLIDAVQGVAPERIGASLGPIVDHDVPEGVASPLTSAAPLETDRIPRTMIILFILMIGVVSIIVSLGDYPWLLVAYPLYVVAEALIVWGFVMAERSSLKGLWLYKARATKHQIELPSLKGQFLFLAPRQSIPLDEVKEVRESLNPVFYGRQGVVVTARGEELTVGRRFMASLDSASGLARVRHTVKDATRQARIGPPSHAVDRGRVMLTVAALAAIPILARLLIDAPLLPEGAGFLLGMSIPPVMMAYIFLTIGITVWRSHLSTKLRVSDVAMDVPTMRPSLRHIPRREVKSIRTEPRMVGYTLLISTERGDLTVDSKALKRLLQAGFAVDDPSGSIENPQEQMAKAGTTRRPSAGPTTEAAVGPPARRDPDSAVAVESHEARRERTRPKGADVFRFIIILVMMPFMLLSVPPSFLKEMWFMTILLGFMIALAVVGLLASVLPAISGTLIRIYLDGIEVPRTFGRTAFVRWPEIDGYGLVEAENGRKELVLQRTGKPSIKIDDRSSGFGQALDLASAQLTPGGREVGAQGKSAKSKGATVEEGDTEIVGEELKLKRAIVNSMFTQEHIQATMFMSMGIFILVMSSVMMHGAGEHLIEGYTPTPPTIPSIQDGHALPSGRHVRESLNLSGNFSVAPDASLTLVDSAISIDPEAGDLTVLGVEEGGRLVLENVTIRPRSTTTRLWVVLWGHARLTGCTFSRENASEDPYEGRVLVVILSDDVVIEDSSFEGYSGVGILIINCSPVVRDCRFGEHLWNGIRVYHGHPSISNSSFRESVAGINLDSADATIANCTFNHTYIGIDVTGSSPSVEGCSFRSCYYGIEMDVGSHPRLSGNSFSGNSNDVYKDWMVAVVSGMVALIFPLMASVMVVALVATRRKGSRELPR